jgi:type VI secretion system protein ImpI/type VI secretion system protein
LTLVLTVLRCPDAVPPETRRVQGGEFTIGRGHDNDWVMPDAERHLSKRHCVLAFRSGGWHIADTSSNGTFLNGEGEPLGPGATRPLRDGDRLRMGLYEIEVRLDEPDAFRPGGGAGAGFGAGAGSQPYRDDPFAIDPFAGSMGGPSPAPRADPYGPVGGAYEAGIGGGGINLPPDFDPLAPEPGDQFLGRPTQPDHTPATGDAFRPPPVVAAGIPDDWDFEGIGDAAPPPAASPAPGPFTAAVPAPAAPPPPTFPAELPAPPPAAFAPSPFDSVPSAPPAPPPVMAPPPVAASPVAPAFPPPVAAPPAAPPPAPPPPAAPPQARAPAGPADDAGLMAAFLRGAQMTDARPADPAATMELLGAAFRAMVAGLRQTLIARAAVKGEFRIEQTVISARGNNPLKFSADDDDALAALLGGGRRTEMSAPAAVADALRDIRLHELASVAAMQAAVRSLVEQLAPGKVREEAGEQSGLGLPGQRRARWWDAYEALHERVSHSLSDDFDSVFGKSFARAYEQALAESAGKERR